MLPSTCPTLVVIEFTPSSLTDAPSNTDWFREAFVRQFIKQTGLFRNLQSLSLAVAKIDENDQASSIMASLGAASRQAQVENLEQMLVEFERSIGTMLKSPVLHIHEFIGHLASEEGCPSHTWIQTPELFAENLERSVTRRMRAARRSLRELTDLKRQLDEAFPAAEKIANKNQVVEGIMGFAAGWFGEDLGVYLMEKRGEKHGNTFEVYLGVVEQFLVVAGAELASLEEFVVATAMGIWDEEQNCLRAFRDCVDPDEIIFWHNGLFRGRYEDFGALANTALGVMNEDGLTDENCELIKIFFGLPSNQDGTGLAGHVAAHEGGASLGFHAAHDLKTDELVIKNLSASPAHDLQLYLAKNKLSSTEISDVLVLVTERSELNGSESWVVPKVLSKALSRALKQRRFLSYASSLDVEFIVTSRKNPLICWRARKTGPMRPCQLQRPLGR